MGMERGRDSIWWRRGEDVKRGLGPKTHCPQPSTASEGPWQGSVQCPRPPACFSGTSCSPGKAEAIRKTQKPTKNQGKTVNNNNK